MDAISLLGSLMGNGAVAPGGGGGLLGSFIGGAMGGGAGGMLGGGGTMGTLGNVIGGAIGGARGGGSSSGFTSKALMGILGGLAVSAVTKYARNKMSGGDDPAQGGVMDIDPDEAMASTGLDEDEANGRAEILIRAMINAAKADGHVDDNEQQNILSRLGDDIDEEEAEFLRHELSSPLDTQGFIQSIPPDMAKEVYAMSLMGIELDENAEAEYLFELAQGLGLDAEVCDDIHRQLGAPEIFG